MDIRSFTRQYINKPTSRNKPQFQFAVLAFDLGVDGANIHMPPLEHCQFSDDPRKNSDSGPWCSQTNNWRPAARVRETGQDRYHVEEYGARETIHAEEWLMGGFTAYLRRYTRAYGQLPNSVCLFTEMSPCPDCIHYLQRFPQANYPASISSHGTIPHWHLSYQMPYLRPADHPHPQPPRYSTHTKDGYADASEAAAAANTLAANGWVVQGP